MRWWLLVPAVGGVWLSACGMPATYGGSGAGATVGGAQDIALARKKVAQGIVPDPQDFVEEGLYSEHDLPVAGPPCAQPLCLAATAAFAPNLQTEQREAFVQLGLSSGVELATFKRRPLNLAVLLDHSGSMGDEKMEAAKEAVHRLVDKLDENDLLTVIEFDSAVNVLIGPEPVTQRERFHEQIRRIRAAGGTCIECGLVVAYEQVESRLDDHRDSRVILLTDAQPNLRATTAGAFLPLVQAHAERGVGLTAMGVGLDFGQELVTQLTSVTLANYVYLADAERTRAVFDEDFDFLVTPIAFDLQLKLRPSPGFEVAGVHGLPAVAPEAPEHALHASTVFLSRRRGAIVARLTGAPVPQGSIASASLSFRLRGGAPVETTLEARFAPSQPLQDGERWYADPGARKTVALTNFVLGAREACRRHRAGDKAGAKALADRTAEYLEQEATALGDSGVRAEADLAGKLAALLH